MAISDRINEMYTHVGDVYDTITNVDLPTNKNIQNIPSTMRRSYLEIMNDGIDTIWNNWEKVEGTGETLTLNSTEEAPMKINLKGNTSQEGTPTPETPQDIHVVSGDNTIKVCGKNLFDNSVERKNAYPNITFSSIGQPVEYNNSSATYSYVNSAHLKAGQEYTISWAQSTTPVSVNERIGVIVDENNIVLQTQITWINSTDTIKFTSNYNGYLILATDINATNIQIEKGSTSTTYEAYQSQSYPIDLRGTNLFEGRLEKGAINGSTGVNDDRSDLYNIRIRTKGYILIDDTIKTLSYNLTNGQCYGYFYDRSKTFLGITSGLGTSPLSFTPISNAKYVRFVWRKSNNATLDVNEISSIELVNGDTPQEITNEAIELCKIGEYQDKIYKNNGNWYLEKNIGKVVLDGSEEGWANDSTGYLCGIINNDVKRNTSATTIAEGYCNYYVPSTLNKSRSNIDQYSIYSGSTNTTIYFNNNSMSLNDFKTWLSTHNTIVYYPLATPTTTEITDTTLISQLEALNGAKSYTTQTNISQENNDLPFILDATALKQLTIEEI